MCELLQRIYSNKLQEPKFKLNYAKTSTKISHKLTLSLVNICLVPFCLTSYV